MAQVSRGRQVGDPGERADHRADQGHRQGQRRPVRGRPEGRRSAADELTIRPARGASAPAPRRARGDREARHGRAVPRARSTSARPIPASSRSTASACRVAPGEVIGLVGENGAGKSTLMKVLGGVDAPTRGRIRVDGVERAALTVADAIAAGIAFVHQELNLFDNLDVAANVFIGREPRAAGRCGWSTGGSMRADGGAAARRGSGSTSRRTRRSPSCRSPSASCSRSPRRCRSKRGWSSWTSRPRA